MNRNANTHFNNNPTSVNIARSVFNRDHSVKFSFNMGDIVPFMVDEVLPGDTVTIDTSKVIRTQPLVSPIMDDIFLDVYYFFVPNRIVWHKWPEFMGERGELDHGNPATLNDAYTVPCLKPYVPSGQTKSLPLVANSIYDYMGIPIGVSFDPEERINSLPFRAYNQIYNDWFRAESFENPVYVGKDNNDDLPFGVGQQIPGQYGGIMGYPFTACKTFDYFTSCLPTPQKGPDVSISGSELPVYFSQRLNPLLESGESMSTYHTRFAAPQYSFESSDNTFHRLSGTFNVLSNDGGAMGVKRTTDVPSNVAYISNAVVDTTNGFMTVNELREAFAIQRYYEKAARGGSRYIELIKTFFGVTSPDARMQRSEYLGGNRIFIDVNQVVQTSATEQKITPQGNVAGMSLTNNVHSDFTKSFTEHGFLIGVCVARYHHTYQQGLERFWSRRSVFDYYNPTFANIGEQPVYKREIYFGSDKYANDGVFGYNEAWADYRYKSNRVAGEMRSSHSTSLDFWHLADNYTSMPSLSNEWLKESPAVFDRCLAVTSDVSNQFVADFYIRANWARCMPLYSIPGLLDHN